MTTVYTVTVNDNGTFWKNQNGDYHREDGPAVEWSDGTKYWYLNGKCHREDGPAVEYADGSKYWYINGVEYTEQEFNEKMNNTIEVNGKMYKLVE